MSLFRNSRLGGQTDWQSRFKEKAQSVTDERLHDFYQAGIVTGDTPLSKVPFVALDFETTGLDAEKDDIVSIGLVPFNLNRIYCNQYQTLDRSPQHTASGRVRGDPRYHSQRYSGCTRFKKSVR